MVYEVDSRIYQRGQKDLRKLDPYVRKLVLKAIDKTAERPLPPPEGIGKPSI